MAPSRGPAPRSPRSATPCRPRRHGQAGQRQRRRPRHGRRCMQVRAARLREPPATPSPRRRWRWRPGGGQGGQAAPQVAKAGQGEARAARARVAAGTRAAGAAVGRDGGGGTASGRHRSRRCSIDDAPLELDEETMERRRGRQRKDGAIGRYQMNVHVTADATHIAILEGRSLVEHYVVPAGGRRGPDPRQHLRGQGGERAAGHGGGVHRHRHPQERRAVPVRRHYDPEDVEGLRRATRRASKTSSRHARCILCQVTKNPIAHKGARLTQEVSLPGRFVVLRAQHEHLRDLQAPARQRAQAAAPDPGQDPAQGARPDRAHRGRERDRRRDRAGRRHRS